ncbi:MULTISPECIES: 50S ribosomal protein L6 [unclassified Pyramidobacter]|uniref:50S ribosomal protein L6 n=1 Tax=unclassified Pyramidobacter TaxID=2632171 RepID=UPI000EA06291|nr:MULTISPECIES: 50S ribosomal protein L6 [unclassified Pyramidobacter]MCI7403111.1 50S ribosomal protein L6 [Pyramidobacter sp.]MDY3212664.1 50S ribosomal protein L6 [Pyramidobacter sp.]RKJ78628.1 50S ribosomal protein L6 [Pyramidobacter sp. CG50-2]
MSRLGRKPVTVPQGTSVEVKEDRIVVKGKNGQLSMPLVENISVEVKDGAVHVARANEEKPTKAAHGMVRAMINNMVIGVTEGYTKTLEIEGVGYRAAMKGKNLGLSLGFSHPLEVVPPEGITFAVEGATKIFVKGIDKQVVGQIAAIIRGYRAPEPYKGKGIHYLGEHILRKAGKTATK